MSRQQVPLKMLGNNSVASAQIVDASIATGDLADGLVTTPKLAPQVDIQSVRVTQNVGPTPNTGQGMEFLYAPATPMAYIQVMDRNAAALRPLTISASNVTLPVGTIDTVEIADGAVTTAKLLANAVTNTWFNQAAPAGSTTSGAWSAMPAPFGNWVISGHTGGPSVLVGMFQFYNDAAGQGCRWGVGLNGGGPTQLGQMRHSVAGEVETANFLWGWVAGNTVTSIQFHWFTTGGTLRITTAIYSFVALIELKK